MTRSHSPRTPTTPPWKPRFTDAAVQGVPEPVWYKGKVVGEVLKYSDGMLALKAKARMKTV